MGCVRIYGTTSTFSFSLELSVAGTSSISWALIVASDGIQRNEKKNLNNDTVEQKRGSCTQILKTYAGVLDRDAEAQTKHAAKQCSRKEQDFNFAT